MIKGYFETTLSEYLKRIDNFKTVNEIPFLKQLINGYKGDLPSSIQNLAHLSSNYRVEGSVGKGNITKFPWVCVFDTEITRSAQHGFYLVYLFKEDMSGFYLSLNQGWTQYEKIYRSKKKGLEKIQENSDLAKRLLRTARGFDIKPLKIRVNENSFRIRGYESGNIAAIYYDSSSVPEDDVLISDLHLMIGVYRELKGIVNGDILKIEEYKHLLNIELDEQEYQKQSNSVETREIPNGPKRKKVSRASNSQKSRIPRDPKMASKAFENAGHKCEINSNHITFISRKSGYGFVEAHHLIPISAYDNFEFDIDVPENIITLCPNCHRAFHYGKIEYISELIRMFFKLRSSKLEERGIKIEVDDIIKLYKKIS